MMMSRAYLLPCCCGLCSALLRSVQIITTYLVGQDDRRPPFHARGAMLHPEQFLLLHLSFYFYLYLDLGQVTSLLFMFLPLPFFILCRPLQKQEQQNLQIQWEILPKAGHTSKQCILPTFIFHHTDQPMCSLHR